MDFVIKYKTLCEYMWNYSGRSRNNMNIILNNLRSEHNFNEQQLMQIKINLRDNFFPVYNKKWNNVSRKKNRFEQKHLTFLNKKFMVKFNIVSNASVEDIAQSSQNLSLQVPAPNEKIKDANKKGRPPVSYNESSEKTKKRRIENIISNHSVEEILRTAADLKNQCHDDSGTEEGPGNVESINNILAMYVDLDLTKAKYNKLRIYNKMLHGNKLYPPYTAIKSAKEKCYPTHLSINDFGASVNVKSLLTHTTERILLTLSKEKLHKLRDKELMLYGKWGMDGASGQQTTRQKWLAETVTFEKDQSSDTDDDDTVVKDIFSDNAVFVISFVPLQLMAENSIVWKNERPSSVSYCRPIKFQFVKESNSIVLNEYKFYSDILKDLKSSCVIENMTFNISFDIKCTMIDGKVCNILTDQKSSNCCNICGVGPKNINNIAYIKSLPCNTENYKFGLSTLHCWIRFMEYLLHISYNLDFKIGYAKGENKILKAERKKKIQSMLKSKLSLTVDVVKQGSGTTNTGNVARSFFAHAESVTEITKLDIHVVKRLGNILQILACGKDINFEKFEQYCLDTAKLCFNLYPWYSMPPSVHKVLFHGSHIIKFLDLPIGYLSEEAQEASNKIFRKARAHYSRMKSRKCTNEDIMHYLLISSDPVISNIRIKQEKAQKELSPEIKDLLIES